MNQPIERLETAQRSDDALVDPRSFAFRLKVLWYGDILDHAPARRYLWQLYYAGEAYEALHPEGVFVEKIERTLGRLLAKHLHDETRHAEIFRALIEEEGDGLLRTQAEEDLGWYLLHRVLPWIAQRSQSPEAFTRLETMEYMAFLHALELRSIFDLCALLEAARRRGEWSLVDSLRSILRDEKHHATYTHRAVFRLAADLAEARSTLARIRRAERRHYREAVGVILANFASLGTEPRSFSGRLRWNLMAFTARTGTAFPLLPHYDELPRHILPRRSQ